MGISMARTPLDVSNGSTLSRCTPGSARVMNGFLGTLEVCVGAGGGRTLVGHGCFHTPDRTVLISPPVVDDDGACVDDDDDVVVVSCVGGKSRRNGFKVAAVTDTNGLGSALASTMPVRGDVDTGKGAGTADVKISALGFNSVAACGG